MVIAIDGPAGAGKSSIAKMIADKLDIFYLNSGNFYRAVTFKLIKNGIDINSREDVIKTAESCDITIKNRRVILDGEDVEDLLHSDAIDALVAPVSAIKEVRLTVNRYLKKVSENCDLIAEGRDIATVVFPDADIKFYLDADPDARAQRRLEQGVSAMDFEEIKKKIIERDEIDRNKSFGGLKIAKDAIYLNTTCLTIEQVYEKVLKSIKKSGRQEFFQMDDKENMINGETVNQTNLQEEYLKSLDELEEGQIVDGEIIQVTPSTVFIDIKYKSEGKISIDEFEEAPQVGDKIKVVLVKKESRDGQIVVSKKKYDEKKKWKDIKDAFQNGTPIKGVISKSIKGGFEVSIDPDLKAFLPISKTDMGKIEDPAPYIGIESFFFIERLFRDKKVNIVLNRKKYLADELARKKEEFYNTVSIGDIVEGVVKTITTFGAFIDLGGFDGLLHINDMSWGHVTKPKEYVKKGQSIKLKVINIDKENNKINLSLKHFTENPWDTFEERYHVNDIITGKITKLTGFGAFIELEEGIEGMAHISEFSWVKKISNPKDIFKTGDEVQCMILSYNLDEGKISLGIKQVQENPWDTISEKYPVGTELERKIVKITNTGAFIELEEGIDGFLHCDDISWTKKVKSVSSMFKTGDLVKVIVIGCDDVQKRIRLGIKQLTENPWNLFASKYGKGSVVEGEISNKTEFTLFVKVEGDIEGVINKSNISEEFVEDMSKEMEKFNVGDKIKAVVTEINPKRQKLSLSIREYKKSLQREEISRYMSENEEPKATLEDFMKYNGK